MRTGQALTKGVIYGIMFGVALLFMGIPLEAVLIMLNYTVFPAGTIPAILFAFGLAGSIAVAFAEHLEELVKPSPY